MQTYDAEARNPERGDRVRVVSIDNDSLQGRDCGPTDEDLNSLGTVVGVSRVIFEETPSGDSYLYAVALDPNGRLVECAGWEIAEDDEMPIDAGARKQVEARFAAEGEPVAPLDPPETFPAYLRRVGGDYAESGNEATAEDYADAASRIEDAAKRLDVLAGEVAENYRHSRTSTVEAIRAIASDLEAR